MPRQEVGESFPDFVVLPELVSEERALESHPIPRHEGKVGIGAAPVNTFSSDLGG